MAEVVLFHHALGLTTGCLSFADELRAAGHIVHTPDLYEGRTFTDLAEGVDFAQQVGFGTIIERGRAAAEPLPRDVVYAGLSLGVLPAQMLAQTRPGVELFLHPGDRHLFADSTSADHDEGAAKLLKKRVLSFLNWTGDQHLRGGQMG